MAWSDKLNQYAEGPDKGWTVISSEKGESRTELEGTDRIANCRNVLQTARERFRKSTQRKSKTWTCDVSLPLQGTRDVTITGGPSAEHLCARTEPHALHALSHQSSQWPCMIVLEKVRVRDVKYFVQGHAASKWWRHMWIQVYLNSFSILPGRLRPK